MTFAPGSLTQLVPIGTTEDSINELIESFVADLSNPSGAILGLNTRATVTINDDDGETKNHDIENDNFVLRFKTHLSMHKPKSYTHSVFST